MPYNLERREYLFISFLLSRRGRVRPDQWNRRAELGKARVADVQVLQCRDAASLQPARSLIASLSVGANATA